VKTLDAPFHIAKNKLFNQLAKIIQQFPSVLNLSTKDFLALAKT